LSTALVDLYRWKGGNTHMAKKAAKKVAKKAAKKTTKK
jgi:hypothetical protein